MSIEIAPSLLSADFARLADEVRDVAAAGADLLHLDIMDGHFVPNLTFGPPVVRAVAPHCPLPLDAHLMVSDPDPLLPALAEAGVARVAVHVEAVVHLHRTLGVIRELGMQPGVSLNPATALSSLEDALPHVDFVLIMTVNPGFGGQRFIGAGLDKIRRLRRMAGTRPLGIAVDGGVGADNAGALADAGATCLIAGTAVFGATDRRRAIDELRHAAERGVRA